MRLLPGESESWCVAWHDRWTSPCVQRIMCMAVGWGTQLRIDCETASRGVRVMVCDVARQVDQPLCVDCAARVREEMEAQTAEIEAECEAYECALRRLEQENAQPLPEEVWPPLSHPPALPCMHAVSEGDAVLLIRLQWVVGRCSMRTARPETACVTVFACVCQEFKAEMAAAAEEERAEMLRAEAAEAALAVARRELDQVRSRLCAESCLSTSTPQAWCQCGSARGKNGKANVMPTNHRMRKRGQVCVACRCAPRRWSWGSWRSGTGMTSTTSRYSCALMWTSETSC